MKSKTKKNRFYLKENSPGLKGEVSSSQVKSIIQKETGKPPPEGRLKLAFTQRMFVSIQKKIVFHSKEGWFPL